ncbi:MAG: tRNA pseudouridine(38-40) synthase TruA [Planctomycetaceae bacterium]|nr:MAG: tRNA pseudouridine(38-40) synthase TruA [Planctomycetaceae bacterium]
MTDVPDNLPPRRNIKLVIAYNGANYHGWQRQAEGFDTIQLHIERTAGRIVRHPVTIWGASRTDAGVHAEGQVANFLTTNLAIPLQGLRRAMNSHLPRDIVVRSAVDAPADFRAGWSAKGKTYRYRIYVSPARSAMLAGKVYHYWRLLDVEAMQDAAARLIGPHDFRGFATSLEDRENTVRTIYRCEVSETDGEILIHVQGNGFLYNMVRNIVGTLIDIGRGHWSPDRIDLIFKSLNRSDAGPTAPPDGLSLMCVHY